MRFSSQAALLLVAAAVALPAQAERTVDFFRQGVPQERVPGVGLLKLKGIDAHRLVVARQGDPAAGALKELSARTGVEVELIRPIVLGWAFVEIRDERTPKAIPDEGQTLALLDRLAADPLVEAVSDDKWLRPLATPNDPGLGQMWHFDIIGAQAAWDLTQGTSSQRVGIIDTGLVRSHEDVGTRAVAGFDFISNGQSANDGGGRDSEFNDPGDGCGGNSSFHGTHVAGTIGARANNGTGVAGLNWNAGLVIGRALGCFGGDIVDIGEAAVWMAGGQVDNVAAIGANKVSVMNLSLGSDSSCSSFEQQVVDFVDSQGTVFVAAAGNSSGGGVTAPVGSPASCNKAVGVGAHGPNRDIAEYSSFGAEIAIVAPGGDFNFGQDGGVLSTIGPNSDFYTFQQGTSMAAPHVAGAISLMQALDPGLTRTEIVSILQSTGAACNGCGSKKAMVLDAALAAIGSGSSTPPPPPPPVGGDDALEENDDFASAKGGVACGDTASLQANAGDQDWFLLDTLPGQSIDIAINAQNGADLDLYVLTGPTNNDIIASSETPTGNESLHIDGDGGAVRVLVNPFVDTQNGVSHAGPYTITIGCSGGTPDPSDPTDPTDPSDPSDPSDPTELVEDDLEDNDSLEEAAEMFCDQSRDLTALDDDFFFVEVRDGDTLAAQVTTEGVAIATQILSLEGEVLVEGTNTDTARLPGLAAGRYVVKVSATGAPGAYTLRTGCSVFAGPVAMSARGGCSSTGEAAAPVGFALLALVVARRRRR